MRQWLPACIGLVFVASVFAGKPSTFATGDGAIRGYDPVAYFLAGQPVPGMDSFTTRWQGSTYKFASQKNLETFESDPERYAPQYGGYCAYAVSQGYTASIDPEAWSIVDGKLYLNYSPGVQKRWEQNVPGYIADADRNWPGVLD